MPEPPWFDWDDANIDHIAGHSVEAFEAEDAIVDRRRRPLSRQIVRGERRWPIIGRTRQGRILFVVFTRRAGLIRIVTARDATESEMRLYRRHR